MLFLVVKQGVFNSKFVLFIERRIKFSHSDMCGCDPLQVITKAIVVNNATALLSVKNIIVKNAFTHLGLHVLL